MMTFNKLRARSKVIGLLAAGSSVIGYGISAEPAEQRCLDLGTNCECSEPLDTASYSGSRPYDAPDSSTKECWPSHGGANLWWDNPIGVSETSMPPGNQVNYVLRQTDLYDVMETDMPLSTTQRWCSRIYQKFSSDYEGTGEHGGACTNNKSIWSPQYPNTQGYLTQGGGIQKFHISLSGFSGTSTSIGATGDELWHHDCVTQWCRFEVCISGNVRAGTNLYAEGEVVALNDGRRSVFQRRFIGNAAGGGVVAQPQPFDGYRAGTCNGTREISHVMVAEWPTDAGQKIGPSYEVEGGSTAGGGGGSTGTVAPPAPVLLP
jgi:hypothetical protein